MSGGNAPTAINQKGSRERFNAAVLIGSLRVGDHHAVINFIVFQERLNDLPPLFVLGDTEHGEALILLILFEFGKPGDLDFAGTAPGGPEIEDNYFSPVIGKMDSVSIAVFEGEVRRDLSALVSTHAISGAHGLRRTRSPPKQRGRSQDYSGERGFVCKLGPVQGQGDSCSIISAVLNL